MRATAAACLAIAAVLFAPGCSKTPKRLSDAVAASKAICECTDADCADEKTKSISTSDFDKDLPDESDRLAYIDAISKANDCARQKGGLGIPNATFLLTFMKTLGK